MGSQLPGVRSASLLLDPTMAHFRGEHRNGYPSGVTAKLKPAGAGQPSLVQDREPTGLLLKVLCSFKNCLQDLFSLRLDVELFKRVGNITGCREYGRRDLLKGDTVTGSPATSPSGLLFRIF